MKKKFSISRLFLWSMCFGFCALAAGFFYPKTAWTQITKTARIELKDARESVPIGAQIYLTQDAEYKLSEQVVASRHSNNLRGTRQNGDVIDLGLASQPSWLVFSVTNNSANEDWILDFGNMMDGRLAIIKSFALFKKTDNGIVRIATHDHADQYSVIQNMYDTALPLKIRLGATDLFIAYIETSNAAPGLIHPRLIGNTAYIKFQNDFRWPESALCLFLSAMAAFFLTAAYMQSDPRYGLFSLYYAGLLAFFLLIDQSAFARFQLHGAIVFSLFPLSILAGLAATRSFLNVNEENYTENTFMLGCGLFILAATLLGAFFPFRQSIMDDVLMFLPPVIGMMAASVIAFFQGQGGKHAGHHIALGWAFCTVGAIIAYAAASGVAPPGILTVNSFWLFLIPQAMCFAAGTVKRIHMLQQEERQYILRESRTAHSLAKLKQSKESADQARLMRVIERERELMVELREREIQRTEEMRLAKEAADEANKAKSNFLAVVSHEIRTPMTGIMGILRLLQDTKLNQEQHDYLLAIQKSGDTMVTLLNDILDFEKIEKGSIDLENIDFDLPNLIQGVVTLMSGHAIDKNVTLTSDIGESCPAYVKGDPARLRQVLLNLVSNAIKFTENGAVTIRLRAAKLEKAAGPVKGDYEIYFAVEDTGIGIAAEAQHKLFSPFEQADATITRKYGGTGLGLAISQRLIAAMGSAIRMTSEEGAGSTFFFTLLMSQGSAELAEEHGQYKRPVQTKTSRLRVLVIEDNAINRKILEKFLEKEGHQVASAESGEEALQMTARQIFDVVFTDLNLSGGMSGLETARALRQSPNKTLANIPIIAITGNVTARDMEDIEKAGMNGLIRKPIPYEELLDILGDVRKGSLRPEKTVEMAAPVTRADLEKQERQRETPAALAPAQRPARSNAMINEALLRGLLQSLGSAQTKTLAGDCLNKADEIIQALQNEQDVTKADFIRDRAHELRGMAANFGLTALGALAGEIEDLAAKGEDGHARVKVKSLPLMAKLTRDSVSTWLENTETAGKD